MNQKSVKIVALFLSLFFGGTAANAVLVTYLPFDGNLNDVAGGHNGSSANATYTNFMGRQALDGNAANGHVVIASPTGAWSGNATANNAITISFYQQDFARSNSSTFWADTQGGINGNRGAQAHVPWGNNTIFWDTSGCCGGPQRITSNGAGTDDGLWHHFVFLKNGGNKQIWRDGILLANQAAGAAALLGLEDLTIGAGSGGGNKFTGLIDDFAVWDNALSADDIQRLANGTNPLWIGVPEPASASLLVLSALGLGMRGSRRRQRD